MIPDFFIFVLQSSLFARKTKFIFLAFQKLSAVFSTNILCSCTKLKKRQIIPFVLLIIYFSITAILLVQGDAVYLATVYFIKPDMICSTGRSQKEFDDQGIGNILWFRNKDGTFIKAPLKMDDADDDVSSNYKLQIYVHSIVILSNMTIFICKGLGNILIV